MKIKLGNTYRDKITSFTGVCTGHAEYISGCAQSLLTQKVKKGESTKAEWFDDQRLEDLEEKTVVLNNAATPGPDRPAPIR